jgi:hypothetical protein
MRSGSAYNTRDYENPDLRVFYLADVDRNKVGATINYLPTYRLSFGLSGEYLMNDYTETMIGLKESTQTSALFSVNYQITDKINTSAFYNYKEFTSINANENKEIEKESFDVWEADLEDNTDSIGLGISLNKLASKWNAGLDWVYTKGKGQINMTGSNATVDDPTGEVTSDFQPIETQQFPDLETSLNSLQLWTQYQHSDTITYRFSYWYERYSEKDWAVDGTIKSPDGTGIDYTPLENDTIDQFVFLGNDRQDYTQHVVGVAVNVRF